MKFLVIFLILISASLCSLRRHEPVWKKTNPYAPNVYHDVSGIDVPESYSLGPKTYYPNGVPRWRTGSSRKHLKTENDGRTHYERK
jgi:hypothetical protein